MLEKEFRKLVVTRQLDDGRWQYGSQRPGGRFIWACGEYTTQRGAINAAVRRTGFSRWPSIQEA